MSVIQSLNTRYFDDALSKEVLDLLAPLDNEREEVHQFIDRMGRIMQRHELGARNFSELAAWMVAEFVPKLLPGAWNDSVPPITLKGRHKLLDRYLSENNWYRIGDSDSMLDLGCGFPPETTMDTARAHPSLKVLGADPSFGKYLIKDGDGHYACFDQSHQLLYFQASSLDVDSWEAIFADPSATRARFQSHLQSARGELEVFGQHYGSIDKDGVNIQINPVVQFAAENLSFVQQGIGSHLNQRFNVVRCMNVLIYFDRNFRNKTFDWTSDLLHDGGLLITGMDWANTRGARVAISQLSYGELKPREIAISIDNLRPLDIISWFTLSENDYETVAMVELAHHLRTDQSFVIDFDCRFDELLREYNFCSRKDNGYMGGIAAGTPPDALDRIREEINAALIGDGFVDRAVESLNHQGIEAWRNCVDFIAVNPESLSI